jgi:O-antigen/teichoic acid export membrane protein
MLEVDSPGRYRRLYWLLCLVDALFAFMAFLCILLPVSLGLQIGGVDIFNKEYFMIAGATAAVLAVQGSLNAAFALTGRLHALARVKMIVASGSFLVVVTALLLAGPTAYLLASLAAGIGTVIVMLKLASREVGLARPVLNRIRDLLPEGWFKFTLQSSLATTLAAGGDNASVTLGGIGGGGEFVVALKISQAPARFVMSIFSPVAAQIYPRAAKRSALGDTRGIRELCVRASRMAVPFAVGVIGLSFLALPFLIPLVYGSSSGSFTAAALLFVIGATLRGVVVWSKVLPLAIGRPRLRLATISVESAIILVAVWSLSSVAPPREAMLVLGLLSIITGLGLATFWWRFALGLGGTEERLRKSEPGNAER